MYDLEAVRTAEFLSVETPTAVFHWLEGQPRRKPSQSIFGCPRIDITIERRLFERRDPLIDLALASWATQDETHLAIYTRHCGRSSNENWPPAEGSRSYDYLRALVSNTTVTLVPWGTNRGNFGGSIPDKDFEDLIEFCDLQTLKAMHWNFGMAEGLLEVCAARYGPYGRMSDDRWLMCIGCLGHNEALHNPDTSNRDGADIGHMRVHENFLIAATLSPKTYESACVFGGLFENLPISATRNSYVKRDVLVECIASWEVDISEPKEAGFMTCHSTKDGLTPAERVQFHVMRNYASPWDVDPESSCRVDRLVSYAISPINGGEPVLSKYAKQSERNGNGLDLKKLEHYSARDGAAFCYATAYNKYLWTNKNYAHSFWTRSGNFAMPTNDLDINLIRESVIEESMPESETEAGKQKSEGADSSAENNRNDNGKIEEKINQCSADTKLLRDSVDNLHSRLGIVEAGVASVKRWLIAGGGFLILVLLMK